MEIPTAAGRFVAEVIRTRNNIPRKQLQISQYDSCGVSFKVFSIFYGCFVCGISDVPSISFIALHESLLPVSLIARNSATAVRNGR